MCSTDAQCVRSGEAGLCIEPGWCAFPDGECDTGYRFAAQAEPGLENECLPFEPGDSSTGSSSTSADTGKVDTLSTTGTDASTTEVDPTTQTTVPITTGPDSESATSTSGGPVTDGTMSGSPTTTVDPTEGTTGTDPVANCEAAFGDVPEFEVCEATLQSCTFGSSPMQTTTCTMMCEAAGASCAGTIDSDPGAVCTPVAGNVGCASMFSTAMCVCVY